MKVQSGIMPASQDNLGKGETTSEASATGGSSTGRRSSVVEHPLGKGKAGSSILPDGTSLAERFWSKVTKGSKRACWSWTGCVDRHGYGQFKPKSYASPMRSHRVAWELTFGPIPPKLLVGHHCDTRRCCNPWHLFVGTVYGNHLDADNKGRVLRGHRHGATLASIRTAREAK